MLVLGAKEIRQALPMAEAIQAMKHAMIALSSGKASIPSRTHLNVLDPDGTLLVMPGFLKEEKNDFASLVVKMVGVFNQNNRRGMPNILGVVNVFDPATGQLLAILNASTVTEIRTAATSAAATEMLANPNASRLAIVGSGVQARSHFAGMCAVRNVEQAWFFAPNHKKVETLVAGLETQVDVRIAASSTEATRDADIVCTTTNSSTPVVNAGSIKPGCHINAIGSYKPDVVEIPSAIVVNSRIYTDHLETAIRESGDLAQPIQRGELDRSQIVGEIGQLFSGQIVGRESSEQVTLFKSVGNTIQDVVAAHLIVERAKELGLGQTVEL